MAIVTSKNTLPTSVPIIMFNLKEFLKTAGWTVPASGDGLALYGAASDVIVTGAAGAGGMAQQKAWYRLKMPGSTREFCIQSGNATTQIRVKYSPVSGFTIGGNATTCPAAADEVIIPNFTGGTDALPTGQVLVNAFNRVSYWADDAAPYGWGMHGWSGAGATTFGIVLDGLVAGTYPAGDLDPYVLHSWPLSANFGSIVQITAGTPTIYGWVAYPAAAATNYVAQPVFVPGATIGLVGTVQFGANPITGKDENLPIVYGRYSTLAAPTGYKGMGTYLRTVGTTRANLSTQTVTTPLDRLVIGALSVPWGSDGVAPLL